MAGSSHQQWILIDEIITLYLDRSEQSNHKFFKCWHIAFQGMQEMGMDFFNTVRSVKLPVNANLTVNLPPDYLQFTKVGVLNMKGEIIPLMYNNKLTTYADLSATRLTKTEDNTLFTFFFFNSPIFYNYWNGDIFENLYGIPSGAPFVGEFKIDNANGIIVLSKQYVYPYVMLEYIASPKEGQLYYIPVQFKSALMWYIAWQDVAMLKTTRGDLGDKEYRRHNYFNERRLAAARYQPLDLQEAYEWGLRNQRFVVKA